MKVKKYIPPLIYLLLVLVCLAAVFLAGRLAKPPGGAGQEGAAPSGEAPSKGSSPEAPFLGGRRNRSPGPPPFRKNPFKAWPGGYARGATRDGRKPLCAALDPAGVRHPLYEQNHP